jgi:hypothetical protein
LEQLFTFHGGARTVLEASLDLKRLFRFCKRGRSRPQQSLYRRKFSISNAVISSKRVYSMFFDTFSHAPRVIAICQSHIPKLSALKTRATSSGHRQFGPTRTRCLISCGKGLDEFSFTFGLLGEYSDRRAYFQHFSLVFGLLS